MRNLEYLQGTLVGMFDDAVQSRTNLPLKELTDRESDFGSVPRDVLLSERRDRCDERGQRGLTWTVW